jgi:hypothetical protein
MATNYFIIGLVALGVAFLIIWIIRRNRRDKKDLERKLNLSDLEPEKHDDDQY